MLKGNGRIVLAFLIAVLLATQVVSSFRDSAILIASTIAGLATGFHLGASRMMALIAPEGKSRTEDCDGKSD